MATATLNLAGGSQPRGPPMRGERRRKQSGHIVKLTSAYRV